MTLHRLRNRVGDRDFFRILRVWAQSRAGDNVTTRQFIRLSETISGEQLDGLFHTWLFTPGRPAVAGSDRPERSSQREMPPGAAATLAIAKREASAKP
jgi:aminopeptidase N